MGDKSRIEWTMLWDWADGLRAQCVSAGVPFFFKRWGVRDIGDVMPRQWPEVHDG